MIPAAEDVLGRTYRLDAGEREQLERDGYVVRKGVYDAAELAELSSACEQVVARLTAAPRRTKLAVGSYVFEIQRRLGTVVKWEPDNPEVIQGVEPLVHLSRRLRALAMDRRVVDPAVDLVGAEKLSLYTEKLNLKRARSGGPIVLHQDFPYWKDVCEDASRIATAMIFLDDSDRANGCLEVAPGSHRDGVRAGREVEGFGSFEMDAALFDPAQLVSLEVGAGSVAFFGPFLVHRSLPNSTDTDRRALLFSYQPRGWRTLQEFLALAGEAA
jgi:ectoine hydroxylase-related dioxygenase (phytanoyl-CoA dioxygenase family)